MMHDQRLERLTFFSDAVFAIAMTLLVIELHVPHVARDGGDRAFLQALADMTPGFVGFLVSFLVIGTFWVGHHRGLSLARTYTAPMAWANLWLLLAIVFLPFASAMLSDYYGARVPHILYVGTLLAAGLLQVRLMRLALADQRDDPAVAALLRRVWAVPIVSGLALLVAFAWPAASVPMLVLIPVAIRVLERGRPTRVALD